MAVTVAVVGFVACAEFGSWAFVHPVIRRLPEREQVLVEKGLLRTFGLVMPVGMTASPVLIGVWSLGLTGAARGLAVAAAVVSVVALATTIAVNVGINLATAGWDPDDPPAGWRATRRRWDRFQGVRSCLLLAGFLLVCGAAGSI